MRSRALLWLCAAWCFGGLSLARGELSNPVDAGREALTQGDGQPWYDAEADDVRAVLPAEAKEPGEKKSRDPIITGLPGAELFVWIAIGLLIAAIVALLIRAAMRDGSLPGIDKGVPETAPRSVDMDALPVPARAKDLDLLAEARALYERGEYGAAIVFLYSHFLVRLDRGQLIRLAKGKTNRQYLREISTRTALAGIFAPVMTAFEEAFFGRRELDRARFEAAWSRLDEFHRLVEQGTAP